MKFFDAKNLIWNFLKRLSNLNFSIFVLLLIIIFSMLGSVIEQDQSLSYYKTYYPAFNSSVFFINWRWIYYLGLDHVYQTWWFFSILFVFMLSLTVCTFSTQLPSFKNARRWKFIFHSNSKKHEYSFANDTEFTYTSLTNIIYPLIAANFFVFHKKCSIYAYKGLYGRIAPIFVHFGIIVTLLGSIVSFFCGFVSQEIIPVGEIFHIKNIIHAGFCSNLPLDLYGRVENFHISYNVDNSIQQFFSKVSLFHRSERLPKFKLISVNSPLLFKGITFYQTDWRINALRIKLGPNYLIQKNLIKANINNRSCWLCSLPIDSDKQFFLVLFNLNNFIWVCSINGSVIEKVDLGECFYVNNVPCSVQNVIISTGLQIKADPGILIVYLGFFTVILSTFLSYISYSQIWVYMAPQIFQFMGSTNRAVLFFEEDICTINSSYKYYEYRLCANMILDNIINEILR